MLHAVLVGVSGILLLPIHPDYVKWKETDLPTLVKYTKRCALNNIILFLNGKWFL